MDNLRSGSAVKWNGSDWIIFEVTKLDQVILKHPASGQLEVAPVSELSRHGPERVGRAGVASITKEQWLDAQRKFEIIKPLLELDRAERTSQQVIDAAEAAGIGTATLYRWLREWRAGQTVSSLVRAPRSDDGVGRLTKEAETILSAQIETFFLKSERPTVVDLHKQIEIECNRASVGAPSLATVKRRVKNLSGRLVMAKRESRKLAREKYEPLRGSFPGADVPRAVYQIDHSPIDVIFVDEVYRRPINRGYMTIVLDSCTRMLAGFCVSLDPPGALATGLALTHAILPKDGWLIEKEIDPQAKWPLHGLPAKIYADNAKEFRGTMLERACAEYGIVMENRPKGLPNYGGHVERLFRTFMKRVQRLPGSTFSNVEERGDYDSEGRAVMTLKEFERWFATFVTLIYHQRRHRGIGYVPPVKLYERFILGTDTTMGIGIPMPIQDPQKLRLDFMPFVQRTIQEYGVRIDNIDYYADVLRSWVHAYDPKRTKMKRQFIFCRDPRDIGEVYFFDPDARAYYPIPYRNLTHPRISLWELNAVRARIAADPAMKVDEESIFRGIESMRRIEEESAAKSRSARRTQQRRTAWKEATEANRTPRAAKPVAAEQVDPEDEVAYEPYDDIEEAE